MYKVKDAFITAIWQIIVKFVFYVNADPPPVTISPAGPIQGAMVGSPQLIHCSVTIPILNVDFAWIGPDGQAITNGSRMVVHDTTVDGNTHTSTLQFTFLREGDEGTYTCTGTVTGVSISTSIKMVGLTGMCTCYITYTVHM